jgi:hypothetical protein
MFKFFKKNKVDIHSVSLPDLGWNLTKNDKGIRQWINPEQATALSINFFDLPPDIPTVKNIDVLRSFYRSQVSQAKGGLIQVDLIEIDQTPAIKTIFKLPMEDKGITYLSSLTIPFDTCSYVIKIQAHEVGMTGIRESVIASKLLAQGKISIDENGYSGWSEDPYLGATTDGFDMNHSEQAGHDLEFPEHPLSRSRVLLRTLETGIKLTEELRKVKGFKS